MESRTSIRDEVRFSEDRSDGHEASERLSTKSTSTYVFETPASIDEPKGNIIQSFTKEIEHWRMFPLAFVFFFVAFALAVGHYIFFKHLHGALAEHRRMEQSQVTAISLLITTAFKACLISTIGMSFAQHLWRILRQKPLRVSRIEQLFKIRSNPLELMGLKAIGDAPVLFLMALSVWLIPIAAIYPPSALTVTSRPYQFTKNLSISILNPPPPPTNNMLFAERTPGLGILPFRAPQLSCQETIKKSTILDSEHTKLALFNITWDRKTSLTISQTKMLEWYPIASDVILFYSPDRYPSHNSTYTILIQTELLECQPITMQYNLSISYEKGVRQLEYSKNDSKPFHHDSNITFPWSEAGLSEFPGLNINSSEFKNWPSKVGEAIQNWNVLALLDASLQTVEYQWYRTEFTLRPKNITLPNGTQVESRRSDAQTGYQNYPTILETSVFNPRRYNNTITTHEKDPRLDLYFDETALNDYITNITISALSLNIWKSLTPVKTTEYHSTYQFSKPINLILPYALSLALALVFVGIGTWSLVHNGVPAVDGGFLQILTTTTGRTEMEKLVEAQHGDGEGASKELLEMQIRYGELVDAEGAGTGRAGFGLVEETRLLKKGWNAA
ncbi:uncharacterized protein K460DRAFT_409441 [Cucurbitaria berberidis CBS 394.84]|uniref:Uncharacterized protein n=1 Tax=Cucurbitaria berberidis CBS 394.84 TaxID=1168544 RepID=A0A9P4GB37_9PLEO|nr:uncharacterized protein K460DRAFT_409441 [Cucurbitaria berberidis CBS 394.84]KAF1842004.1 hypothetical protein K460DRAFT_409441 [Cucurbitaria berberidis CBS 394.84]